MSEKQIPEHYPILIVDDHPTNRQILHLLLDKLGLENETASSGKEAVALATTNSYGAILMDVMMPEMNGYEATRLIREHEFGTAFHTPIIAVTALDLATARSECLAAGMDDFMVKPISGEALRDRLERWLQRPVAQLLTEFKDALTGGSDDPINRERLKLLYGTDKLGDVLNIFLTASEALLAELKAAIASENAGEAGRIAHELKGSAFAVSAEVMATLAKDIEVASKDGDWTQALKMYAELALAFVRVQHELINAR